MQHDEGGPFDALLLGAFRDFRWDYGWDDAGMILGAVIAGAILWRAIPAALELFAIAETSTDQSLSK